jgi:hypothetical protein
MIALQRNQQSARATTGFAMRCSWWGSESRHRAIVRESTGYRLPPTRFGPPPRSRISDLGSRISDLGSRISDLGSRISDLGSRISDLGSRRPPEYQVGNTEVEDHPMMESVEICQIRMGDECECLRDLHYRLAALSAVALASMKTSTRRPTGNAGWPSSRIRLSSIFASCFSAGSPELRLRRPMR